MGALLRLSGWIDALNERVGKAVTVLVLAAVLIAAGNAAARKTLGIGSNAFLEIQWYLFSAVFLLGAGYTLLHNGHVRIDVIAGRLAPRTQALIDLLGLLLVLLPLCVLMIDLGGPLFARAWASGERSQNAGGLIRWPVLLLPPAGFALLLLQGLSEAVKRIAFLTGRRPQPFSGPAEPGATPR